MNRIQFFVLLGLSSLVVLLLISQVVLAHQVAAGQLKLAQAQQQINQAQVFQGDLKQLAVRIFQDSEKTQDQALKDLLKRQQITYTPGQANGSSSSAPSSPAPALTH